MNISLLLVILCTVVLVRASKKCSVGPDCPKEMCCMGTAESQGYCRPLKAVGEDCQMYSGIPSMGQSPLKVPECRCMDGTYCGSDDPNPPLGARGTCRGDPIGSS